MPIGFITVGEFHVVNRMGQEASESRIRGVGDIGHMITAASTQAVIQDSWHDLFGANPASRARK